MVRILSYLLLSASLYLSPETSNLWAQSCSIPPENAALNLDVSRYERNAHILNQSPRYLKPDGRPKATAGVVLYTYDAKGDAYVLLAREQLRGKDLKVAGKYCELSGSMERKGERLETFLEGCLRECREEIADLYTFSPEEVLEKAYTYFSDTPRRQVVEVFLETATPYTTSDLLAAQRKFTDPHYLEKDDLKWVRAEDLLKIRGKQKEAYMVKDITGMNVILPLRSYFIDLMNDPQYRDILIKIATKYKASPGMKEAA